MFLMVFGCSLVVFVVFFAFSIFFFKVDKMVCLLVLRRFEGWFDGFMTFEWLAMILMVLSGCC